MPRMNGQPPRQMMGELQALVTGALIGALMKAADGNLQLDVEPVQDAFGYLPEIRVQGRRSGERVVVRVERVEGD